MKSIISSLIVGIAMLLAVASSSAQEVSGLFEEGVLLDSNRTYSSSYYIDEDTQLVRGLFDLTETGEYVAFHYMKYNNIDLLFLMPRRDFTREKLADALLNWDRTELSENVVIFANPEEGERNVEAYNLNDKEDFLFIEQKDGVALYTKVRVSFIRKKRGDLLRKSNDARQ